MKKFRTEAEVFWSIPWNSKFWARVEALGRPVKNADKNLQTVGLGPILNDLPKSSEIFIFYCTADKEAKTTERIICHLAVRSKPSGKAPKWVTEQNEALGGKKGLAELLSKATPKRATIAKFEIELEVDGSAGWKSQLLHKNLVADESVLQSLGKEAYREEIGYRFENGVLGMEELSIFYDHEDQQYLVAIQASAPLKFDTEINVPFVDQLSEFVVSACFAKQGLKVSP